MKVILVKDTPNVGQRHDIVNVSNGHGRNFLIPNGFATEATEALIVKAEAEREKTEAERKAMEENLLKTLASIDGETVTLKVKANDKGHLFEGITSEQIVSVLNAEKKTTFTASHLSLEKPIKEIGDHAIVITVGEGSATFTAKIEAE